jgi:hypothetical protein
MPRFIAGNPQKLDLYYRSTKRFSPEEKQRFLAAHAGLWVRSSEAVAEGLPFKINDLLEIKPNGIIWEVIEWDVSLPGRDAGSPARLIQVRTAYVVPYGALKNDTLNDAYTIHQTFLRPNDTCFGGWNFIDLWHMAKSGDSLIINRKKYAPYAGPLASFFPAGIVDLVGTGGNTDNPYFKRSGQSAMGSEIELTASIKGIHDSGTKASSLNALTMPTCLDLMSLGDLLKSELNHAFSVGNMVSTGPGCVDSLLSRYYQPFLIDEHFRSFPRPLPKSFAVSFQLRRDGSPDNIRIDGPAETDKMLVNELVHEIAGWKLPPPAEPFVVRHAFSLP